jgi:hypothetical protein
MMPRRFVRFFSPTRLLLDLLTLFLRPKGQGVRRRARHALLAAAVLVAAPPVAEAAEAGDGTAPLDFSLNGAIAAHYATGSAELDDVTNLFGATGFLKGSVRRGPLSLYGDSEIQMQRFGDDIRPEHWWREAYAEYAEGDLDVRLGRQLVIWGRADKFNPTDVVTPSDFGFLTTDDQGQRFGVIAATARYALTDELNLIGVFSPAFRSSILPRGIVPGGIDVPSGRNPDVDVQSPQFGIKLDRTGAGFDASLSYYHGLATSPGLTFSADRGLNLVNPRIDMVGADFAFTRGQWGFRGEAAYTAIDNGAFPGNTGPHSTFFSVLGVERELDEHNLLLFQYLHRNVFGHVAVEDIAPPLQPLARVNQVIYGQFDRVQDGVALSLNSHWLDDTLRTELAAAVWFNRGDFVLRPKVSYSISDDWRIAGVVEFFGGPGDSQFGALRRNNRLFVELRRSF